MSEMLEGYVMGQSSDRNNGMWGGDCGIWFILILLFFCGGWGGNGGWNNGNRNCATTADVAGAFNFNQLDNGVRGIERGICDSTFALNNAMQTGFTGIQQSLCNGFNSTGQAISNLGYQMQNCCCDIKGAIKDVAYQNERNTCDIIQANNMNTQRIVDIMTNNTIQDLRDKASTYELQLSQQAQSANLIATLRPNPIPAYVTCSPYESAMWGQGFYNRFAGCGCNSCNCC